MSALGARHRDVALLRTLLRDRAARDDSGLLAIDSPRAIDGALDRDVPLRAVYVAVDAAPSSRLVAQRATNRDIAVYELEAGVADRIADVRTSSGIFALAPQQRAAVDALEHGDFWLALVHIGDPGNLGTLVRAAEAAGAHGIIVGSGSVDVYNPKVVRASAGAVFGIPVVEGDTVTALATLRARGVRCLGAAAGSGMGHTDAPFGEPVCVVLGHETRGLGDIALDGHVHVPMAGAVESLNVAMAGTVLLFEVARQRAGEGPR